MSFPDVQPYPQEVIAEAKKALTQLVEAAKTVQKYPQHVLHIQTPEGFEQQFHILWGTDAYKTRESCYEDLEAHYEHFYGVRRYEDFNSFRNCLAYRRKKKKKL